MNKKSELLKCVGNISQILGVKDYTLHGGRANGVRCFDARNGSGLEYTIIPDRGLDIANLSFKSVNFGFMTCNGITSPQYYSDSDAGFLRNFYAGFLTTCGLRNVGDSCIDEGEELVAHGRISCTPAEEVYAGTEFEDDSILLIIKGKLKETKFFGENLELNRQITSKYGDNRLIINDIFLNNGSSEQPFMLLYHFNFGYPLLSSNTYLIIPSSNIKQKGEESVACSKDVLAIVPPTKGFKGQVFNHEMRTLDDGRTFVLIFNPVLKMGAAIWFNKNQLNNMIQWKNFGESEYILSLELCNCHTEGRVEEKKKSTLQYIQPGESKHTEIEIEILDNTDRVKKISKLFL